MTKSLIKTKTYVKPLAAAITAAISTIASAQDVQELAVTQAKAQSDTSYKVEESSSHKISKPLLDTAKTITVVNQAVMKDRNVDSLRDALRNVSGISMAAGEGGSPTGDSMSIRGFSATSDIFVDGIRDIAGYNRDMYNIEQVEVAKGPGSAVSGRGSTGGSVNLATKTAKLDEFNDVSVRLGTESDYRAKLDSNTQLSEVSALRVNVMANDGDVAGRDHVENSNKAVAVSYATGLGTKSRFTLNADYQKQDNIPDYGLPWVYSDTPVAELAGSARKPSPVSFSNFYGNLYRDFEDIEAKSATARYEYDVSPQTMIRAQARVGSVERQSITTAPRYIDITTSTDIKMSDEKTRDTKNSLAAVQLDLIGEYTLNGYTHNLVTGVEFANENYKRWAYVALTADNLNDEPVLNDLYNPDAYLPYTGQYGRNGTSIEGKGKNAAVYVFDTVTLSKQWDISGGLRYDHFKVDYQNDYNDPSAEISNTDSFVSWNLATVYKPSANTSIYFGAGNSFNPSAEGLTLSDSTKVLEPEETKSYELGAKWSLFDNALSTNVAIFKTIKDNARVTAGKGQPYEITGEQEVTGLELSATGQVNPDLLLIASYTYQDSEVVDDIVTTSIGNELARTPKHSASFWGKYEINEKLSAGIGAQYLGERYNGTTATRSTAPSYTIFDLMVSYQVSNQLNVQFNGENLTDKAYVDQLGGGHFVPGNGRYFSVTANYSF
ncbi:TonB-dependent receptor [Thalassotalea piscium]